jgi:hypothetical protein
MHVPLRPGIDQAAHLPDVAEMEEAIEGLRIGEEK